MLLPPYGATSIQEPAPLRPLILHAEVYQLLRHTGMSMATAPALQLGNNESMNQTIPGG